MKPYFFALSILIFVSCSTQEKRCVITGEIKGPEKTSLLLFKASRFPNIEAEIPINDNKFTYMIKYRYPEVYELAFKEDFYKGSMMVTSFFSEEGNIKISLKHEGESSENTIQGFNLNTELNNYGKLQRELFWNEIEKYSDSLVIMFKDGTAFSKEFQVLNEKLSNAKNDSVKKQLYNELRYLQNTGNNFTPKAKKIKIIQDSIVNKEKLWEFDYIENNTSLVSYYSFLLEIKSTSKSCCWQEVDKELINKAQDNLNKFTHAFPDHPYNVIIQNTINGLQTIHIGGRFIDFTSLNSTGDEVSLASIIKNKKFVLLDFWSKWCGPCLQTSKELVPIYEEYKDKDFEIIGITQEYSKSDSIENFILKQQYPWITIIDKNNKQGLWDKYNLSEQAGGLFLINASGQIIDVNMTAKRVKKFLDINL